MSAAYNFEGDDFYLPYIKGTVGFGHGWLGAQRSAYISEVHLGLSGGIKYLMDESYYFITELSVTGFIARTRPPGRPFDFTKVLVNPIEGNIYVARVRLGVGVNL